MKFTGEFFIPYQAEEENLNNPELETEHKQRYLSILSMVEGKTVLDIASGEGYGTSILSGRAKYVFGVDINPDLVEHAGRKYAGDNIRFLHGSVDNIPLESKSVDVIVSFETLEHVSADTQKHFFEEAKRVLKEKGVFIVSTPNKSNYTDRYNHENKFHLHELYRDEFDELLRAHFEHTRLYDQGLEVNSMILDKEDYLAQKPVLAFPVNNTYHFEGKYLIGVASQAPEAIEISISSVVPESEKSYFQLIDRILELQGEVENLGAWGTRSAAEVETMILARTLATENFERERTAMEELLREKSLVMESLDRQTAMILKDLETGRESLAFYMDTIRKLQEELAFSNHKAFLMEAELEVIGQNDVQRKNLSMEMDSFSRDVDRLNNSISHKSIKTKTQASSEKGKLPPLETSSIQNLQQQMVTLQQDLDWYKMTYEKRSLLGVIKQKIADKFRK